MAMNTNPAHIVLRNVRLSFVHLMEPHAQNGGEPKYSAKLLIPKTPENQALIQAAVQAAAQKGREKHGAAFPAQPKTSIHDGDGPRPSDGQPYGEECKGCLVVKASNKMRPGLVDLNGQPILEATEVYSGIYANVGVTFFAYNAPQNKGIGLALDNVQKVSDGEPLGGVRVSAEDDFGPVVTAPAAPAAFPAGSPAYVPEAQNIHPVTGLPF